MTFVESIIESCPDGIVVCDQTGIIRLWNEQAERLFGWSRQEAIGGNPAELFIPGELRRQYGELLQAVSADLGDVPNRGHRRITAINRSGKRLAVEFWYRTEPTEDGLWVIGYFRDASRNDHLETLLARRELESQLLDQTELFATEGESLAAALQMALNALCQATGWPIGHALLPNESKGGLLSTNIWSAGTDESFQQFKTSRRGQLVRPGQGLLGRVWKSGQAEWQLFSADEELWCLVRSTLPPELVSVFAVPVRIRRRVIAVLEFFCADTERPDQSVERLVRRLVRTLGYAIERREWQEDRQRMAAIVESSVDAIISKSPDGTITSWNGGAEQLYGYTSEEAIGNNIRMILPEGMTQQEPEVLRAIRTGRRLEQFETRRRRRSGELVDVSLTISPLRSPTGRIVGFSTIERDITRRIEAQARLQKAIADAEAANQARTEFMANISHELRTPMNAILGLTELSLSEAVPDVVRDYLRTVKDSADTMLFLVNDILDFSRLEAGGFELDPVPFDPRRMLDETMRTLSLRAHEKGLELVANVDADVPLRLLGDPLRLRQMLTNLVGNAIKFTEQGEVVVQVEPLETADSRQREWQVGDSLTLHFSVRDSGIGISVQDQQRIFDPFTQADASMTRSYAGTGLGLAICQEMAQLHGGRLWVESEEGRGSTFHFTASLQIAAATAASDEEKTFSSVVDGLADTRVLVVDDNETTRQILKEMLQSWSMVPTVVDSADAAFREMEAASAVGEDFSLLIVDAVMPQTDGIELLSRIERTADSSGSSILMMSPADQHLFRRRSEGLSVGAFLEKPVSQSSLLNSICEAVGEFAVLRSPVQTQEPASRRLNVLVAEDISANQKVVSAILTRRGHLVTIAHNGREAIDLHERGGFDVILMDVQMPIQDGLQATRSIRSLEASTGCRTPIVAMTAHAMRGDREACLAAGMDAYVSKPLDAELLLRTVEKLAEDSAAEAPPARSVVTMSGTWQFRSVSTPGTGGMSRTQDTAIDQAAPESLWKPEIALKRLGGDEEILISLIDCFLEDAPDLLQQLKQQISDAKDGEATRMAHSLKGLSASFDATIVTDTAQQMETFCRNSLLEQARPLLARLEQEVRHLSEALALWKDKQS
ncbi:MAG: PAS domain S-box protein [Fuerstiella sp.]